MNKARAAKTIPPLSARETIDVRASADRLRQWMHESLRDLPHESAILSVGCEEAFLASQLAEYAASVTVMDTSGVQVGQLARRFPEISFLRHDATGPLPFADGMFDVVWCCELLDRVFDPAAVLRELHRVLAPGGRLLVTVPYQGATRHVLRALFGRDKAGGANPHICDFTARALAKLVRAVGFLDIEIKSVGSRPLTRAREPRRLLLQARKRPAMTTLKRPRRLQLADAPLGQGEELALTGRNRAA